MGASVAYHLAERGGIIVTLLEREEQFGQGSTGRCAGGIRHQFSTEVNIRLSIESIRMMERFPQEIGQEIGLNQIGFIMSRQSAIWLNFCLMSDPSGQLMTAIGSFDRGRLCRSIRDMA